MLIHVVEQGDTIQSVADHYAYPEITYTVKEGDSLTEIAKAYNVTLMQLLMNNPDLSEREFIYPGETIIIKYSTKGKIAMHGNTAPYINTDSLKKTLPYLTYLSVLNYTATKEGEIITYYDDTEIIKITKDFGVVPLMLLTTLTIQGKANIGIAFDILLNKDFQNRQIDNILNILKTKGYKGINISFEYINISNVKLYEDYFTYISKRLSDEGYLVFVTVSPNITVVNNEIKFEKVDFSVFNQLAHNIIFMNYEWVININPPSPISSINNIDVFLNYINNFISTEKVIIGLATIGYDWELPYSAGLSTVTPLTLDRAIDLARDVGAEIQFDEISQTPFFVYTRMVNQNQIAHIVWFIDARSINALLNLVTKYKLNGVGVWNIMIYNPQLWLLINSQYEIEKSYS